jgi:Uma2 family endonuclease
MLALPYNQMPTVVTDVPARPAPQEPPRKRWTREECALLESLGVFDQHRVELVEGELISKMGKRRPHVDSVNSTWGWLVQVFGLRFVNAEAPIEVAAEDNATNEPEPDIIVLKRGYTKFRSATPRPQDLELLVEIADTSLAFDLSVKAALYARAEIPDYWVLDIQSRRLIVHRNPQSGQYTAVVAYSESESIAPLAAPDAPFKVADAFPD